MNMVYCAYLHESPDIVVIPLHVLSGVIASYASLNTCTILIEGYRRIIFTLSRYERVPGMFL